MNKVRWKDGTAAYQKYRYHQDVGAARASARKWYQEHRDEILTRRRALTILKPGVSAARQRAWRKRHPHKAAAYQKAYFKRHPGLYRRFNLRKKFALTLAQADSILSKGCGICKGKATCIDHDHTTNKVRGGLCATCNGGLGMFFDSPKLLNRAIRYLTRKRS